MEIHKLIQRRFLVEFLVLLGNYFGSVLVFFSCRVEIPFVFQMMQSGLIHGLAFWFDVAFVGSLQVLFSSSYEILTTEEKIASFIQNMPELDL